MSLLPQLVMIDLAQRCDPEFRQRLITWLIKTGMTVDTSWSTWRIVAELDDDRITTLGAKIRARMMQKEFLHRAIGDKPLTDC